MLGIPHVVDPASVEEVQLDGEPAETFAVRMARAKASEGATRHPDKPVLGADTVVVVDGLTLGQPRSAREAEEMLARLGGREHQVVTAVALASGGWVEDRCDVTRVWFRPLSSQQIRDYVATGEPLDKAGAYAVQGVGGVLVERVEGDFFGVMGLPVRLVVDLLATTKTPYSFTR
ncbi:MAG: septum formation protein Maf [Gemmatimonadetes bacterium RBG_16_66_8]|nr:MAG: septum formation protein Maf [Gemmatimonadetes bacterium RBG_16_66_8]